MFNLGRVTDSEKLAEKLKAGSGHDHFIAIAGFSTPFGAENAAKSRFKPGLRAPKRRR